MIIIYEALGSVVVNKCMRSKVVSGVLESVYRANFVTLVFMPLVFSGCDRVFVLSKSLYICLCRIECLS